MKCASVGVIQLAGTETSDRPGALVVTSIVDALTRYLIKLTLAYVVRVGAAGHCRVVTGNTSPGFLAMSSFGAIE